MEGHRAKETGATLRIAQPDLYFRCDPDNAVEVPNRHDKAVIQ